MQMSHKLEISKMCYGCEQAPLLKNHTFDGRNFSFFYAASVEWHKDMNICSKQLFFILEDVGIESVSGPAGNYLIQLIFELDSFDPTDLSVI